VILNIVITIICASQWGILGILLGKVVSSTTIALFWKPYYLYHSGFKLPVSCYWKGMLPHYFLFAMGIVLFYPIVHTHILPHIHDFIDLLLWGGGIIAIYAIAYIIILYICTTGMRNFVCRIPIVHNFLRR
jgi:hypothetical protein